MKVGDLVATLEKTRDMKGIIVDIHRIPSGVSVIYLVRFIDMSAGWYLQQELIKVDE